MDQNLAFVMRKKAEKVIENLEKNNMNGYFVEDEKAAVEKVKELIKEGDTVSVGGSMTLFETGIIDFIRNGKYHFLDRYQEGLNAEQIKEIFRKSFSADVYLTSSNAVTEKGELYNVDGRGNRVAAMLFGPDKVIVVVGVNKIVKDTEEAEERRKAYAAPANVQRLSIKAPCAETGYCMDCQSEGRICNEYTLIKRQGVKGRIHVIIVNKQLGY